MRHRNKRTINNITEMRQVKAMTLDTNNYHCY